MFIFLLLTGFGCIILGICLNKQKIQIDKSDYGIGDNMSSILMRLDNIEKILFDTDISDDNEHDYVNNDGTNDMEFAEEIKTCQENLTHSEETDGDEALSSPAALEKYKKIARMEINNYTIEMICEELGMSKGEVILLKNLFKDY